MYNKYYILRKHKRNKVMNRRSGSKERRTIFQRFGLFFYDRSKTTFALWLALIVFGFLSYAVFMQRQGFPNIEVPINITSGTYFVNNRTKVDDEIVKPLAEIAAKQSNVKTVTSTAGDNFFSMVIEYKDGTKTAPATDSLKSAVSSAGFMPKTATLEYRNINASKFNNQYDVILAVYQPGVTETSLLAAKATEIATGFNGTSGVESVKVINPFKTGTSPITGEPVTLQQTFDRVGIRENGKIVFYPSVAIGVIAKSGTDAIHLEDNLNQQIKQIHTEHDARIEISAGIAENVKGQISNLQTNLIEGLVVVIIISLLLISWRAGLATALSMVSVLLITVGILYVFGITLNTITLFALVLCLGLIVDDTTIMAEAIDAGRKAKFTNREIVASAIKRVARASTAGTLVTMLAFAPMLFISGILGSFIRVLPITIIISLAVSLLTSLTLIPFFSRWLLLSKNRKVGPDRSPVLRLENWTSTKLANLIRVGRRSHKKALLIGAVAALISVGFLGGSLPFFSSLKFDIFPATKDSDQVGATLTFKPGTTIKQAETITDRVNTKIAALLGDNLVKMAYTDSGTTSSAKAQIKLLSFKKREVKSPALVKKLNDNFAAFNDARVKFSQLDAGPPKDDLPFRVQIYSEDKSKSTALAEAIQNYLKGRTLTRTSNKTSFKVVLTNIDGASDSVKRVNAKQLVEVSAGFDADDVSALVTVAQKAVEDEFNVAKIKSFGLTKNDVKFNFGEESNNQASFKTMLLAFPVLLVVMYILLALQFGSLLQPLLIFMAIPFSFFGVAAGLHYTNNPLSFFVMIGFFALIGIAVNNTILLTDFANQAHKEGNGAFESMALAVKARFRPLITTSLTSVVALIPLALSDPFWESLAFTLIFGLLSSTFLVIVSFPYFYLAVEYLRMHFSRSKGLIWIAVTVIVVIVASKIHASLIFPALLIWNAALIVRRITINQLQER
jgi:multidrug efflux pump subunit AcrB